MSSRGILCVLALVLALSFRLLLGSITWIELLLCSLLLVAWPQIEIIVHWAMHHITGTQLFNRHTEHHDNPEETALGTLPTYLAYLLMPIPAYLAGSEVLSGLTATLLFALTTYELIHFSNHMDYAPKTAWGRWQREHHLMHHSRPSRNLAVVFPPKAKD